MMLQKENIQNGLTIETNWSEYVLNVHLTSVAIASLRVLKAVSVFDSTDLSCLFAIIRALTPSTIRASRRTSNDSEKMYIL